MKKIHKGIHMLQRLRHMYQWLKRWNTRVSARYYVNQFLGSPNGVSTLQETGQDEMQRLEELAENLLIDDWIPNQKKLHEQFNFTICDAHELNTSQLLAELFDAPLRLPYDWYYSNETNELIHIQVMTALALSGQLSKKDKNLYIIIIERDHAILETMSALTYKVCHAFDMGSPTKERQGTPPAKKVPIPEYV